MLQAAWTRFARKAVVDQAGVKPGEIFTVLTDDRAAPEIAEAVYEQGLLITKNTQLISTRSYHFSEEPVHFNKALASAIAKSDVVLSICETRVGQVPEVHAAVKGGTRVLIAEAGKRVDFLIDGLINVDYEGVIENTRRFCDLWHQGGSCRLTARAGTDLTFEIGDRAMLVSEGAARNPGEMDWFPGTMANVAPIETSIQGKIVVDGSLYPFGIPEDLVTLHIKDGVMQDITGGKFAARWKAWVESLKDPVAYQLCHISVGLNPRAELTGWTTEDERVLGAITVGFGRQGADWGGTIKGGEHHLDVILSSAKLVAGEYTLLDDNVLTPDLGFKLV